MTIQSTGSKVTYQGNGATTVFGFTFACPNGLYLQVTYIDADGVETVLSPSLYSVAFASGFGSGSVTYPLTGSPIAVNTAILIQRVVPYKQLTKLTGQGGFFPEVVEGGLDFLEMQIQQLLTTTLNALTFPLSDNNPQTVLPVAALRAGKYLTFDALGNPQVTASAGGPPSDLSPYTALSTGSSTARTLAVRFADMVNVKDWGALGNIVHDDAANINAAIVYVSTHGTGGGGVFFPQGSYLHNTAITLKSSVTLWGQGGAGLIWGGGATPQITSATTGYLSEAGIVGLDLASGAASRSILLNSPWRCVIRDVTVNASSATSIVLDIVCNASGTLNPDGNYNAVFNDVTNFLQTGTCGTFVRLRGNALGPPGQFVTLNTFKSINALGCCVRGIDFSRWCDSNHFSGVTRVSLIANNAVGVEFGSNDPVTDEGTYSNNFTHLAVDTFGVFLGRVGFKMNSTKFNQILHYYNEPTAEGGSYIISALCQSYDFVENVLGVMTHRTSAPMLALGAHDMDVGTGTGSTKDFRLFSGGYMQARVRHDVAAVNWWDIFGSLAGAGPILRPEGADTNIPANIFSKGAASVAIGTNQNAGGKFIALLLAHVANAVNYWTAFMSATGVDVILRASGDDTNINANIQAKGSGVIVLGSDTAPQAKVLNGGGVAGNNVVTLIGSNAGDPAVGASGGELKVGTHGWKFTTQNAVSPTSPNRTFTIVVDGVTYYLHGKTTND